MTAAEQAHEWARADKWRAERCGSDLNPFSTSGGRHLWQQGFDGKRPANLVDNSTDWRMWERGRQARILQGTT